MPCARSTLDGGRGISRGVALVEPLERRVVDRLERGDDEQASARRELGPQVAVAQHVLHLHGRVEGHLRVRRVHGTHDAHGVAQVR